MKKKKEKVTYIDDGRRLSDMSGVRGGFDFACKGTTASPKDIWSTYWSAVRMMFKPMLVVSGFLCVVYAIVALIFLFA